MISEGLARGGLKFGVALAALFVAAVARAAPGQAVSPAVISSGDGADAPPPPMERRVAVVSSPGAPRIDGHLDEAAWSTASPATGFVQRAPNPGAPSRQRTEVRVIHTADALYVGARMFDTAPDSIVARLAPRDQAALSDWFTVMLDANRDGRSAYTFAVNAAGVRRDLLRYDDVHADADWDAVWDAAVRIDADGWTAEIHIPLSQLRFRKEGEPWRANFSREIARYEETSYWAAIPPEAAGFVSLFGELTDVGGLTPVRRLELRPYGVARVRRAPGNRADPFFRPTYLLGNAGGDVQIGLSSAFTLTATINPDFGQVEADASELNLSAYETFLSEKRPFFLEGADLFQSGYPMLLYSRRIGRSPTGSVPGEARWAESLDATSILGAAKLTGRTASGWSVAVLDAVTAEETARWIDTTGAPRRTAVEPLTNYGAARVSRDFRGGRSAAGGMLTAVHRRLEAGEGFAALPAAAWVAALDARHRFGGGNLQVEGSVRTSRVEGSEASILRLQRSSARWFQRPDADHVHLDSTRTGLSGTSARVALRRLGGGAWRWSANAYAISPGFEVNDLGFGGEADRAGASAMLAFEQFEPGRRFRQWDLSAFIAPTWTFGGELLDAWADLSWGFQLHSGWSGYAFVQRNFAGLSVDVLRGGPALVVPNRQYWYARVDSDRRRRLSYGLTTTMRSDEGTPGRRTTVAPSLAYRPEPRLELSLRPSLAWETDPAAWIGAQAVDGERRYLFGALERRTASVTARLAMTFTPALSLQLYAQPYVSAGGYDSFSLVEDSRAPRWSERFRTLPPDAIERVRDDDGRRYRLDLDRDGERETTLRDPDFGFRELRSNAVLRWDYRPGSTLWLAWSHDRSSGDGEGSLDFVRDARRLMQARGTNVLLLKVSYWLAP